MYKFVIEKWEVTNETDLNIYPILEESPLDLKDVMRKVLDFAKEHPNGQLITSDFGHLIEYEVDGAKLCCYVEYAE